MSVEIVLLVMQRYPAGSNQRMVAVSLADVASDDGQHIAPTVADLAQRCMISPRAVQRHLQAMLASGWLLLVAGSRGRGLPNEYRISPQWLAGGELDQPPPSKSKAARSKPTNNCDHEVVAFRRMRARLADYNRKLLRIRRFPSRTTRYVVQFDLDVSYSFATLAGVQRHFDGIRGKPAKGAQR